MTTQTATHLNSVQVRTPARLHLGFLDLNGSAGRKFGSFGLAINSHYTTVKVSSADTDSISAPTVKQQQKAASLLSFFYDNVLPQQYQKDQLNIQLTETIPEHAGLGSGTQFSLAIITALANYYQFTISTRDIAQAVNRGRRSGIGIATFDKGGFVVDGGNKPDTIVPPVLMQAAYPQDWQIVLIMDPAHQGIHGQQEISAFKQLPVFPDKSVHHICHLTLMQLLPALIEQDIDSFGDAISQIQALVGDHFAPAQGGRYTSKTVEKLLLHAQSIGFTGIAQSSWGPTGCVFTESKQKAEDLVSQLNLFIKSNFTPSQSPNILICQANNTGALISNSPTRFIN